MVKSLSHGLMPCVGPGAVSKWVSASVSKQVTVMKCQNKNRPS